MQWTEQSGMKLKTSEMQRQTHLKSLIDSAISHSAEYAAKIQNAQLKMQHIEDKPRTKNYVKTSWQAMKI